LQRPGITVAGDSDCQGDSTDDNGKRQANSMDRRREQKGPAQAKPGDQQDSGKTMQYAKRGEQNAHPVKAIANQGNGCAHRQAYML
jgi:hypothetical protein